MKRQFLKQIKSPFKVSLGVLSISYLLQNEQNNKHAHLISFLFGKNPFSDLSSTENDTYLWGNGTYQSKPDSVPKFPNYFPKKQKVAKDSNDKVHNSPDLVDVVYYSSFLLGVDKKGNLWKFKNKTIEAQEQDITHDNLIVSNKNGESSKIKYENFMSDLESVPGKGISTSVRIVQENVYLLNDQGKVFRSKVDKIMNKKPDWKEIKNLGKIKQVETGSNHVLFLNDKGDVYALGDDTHGQCGSGDNGRLFSGPFVSRVVRNPQIIESLKGQSVKKMFVGGSHNFVLTESGQIFGWGFNNLMQLGHEDQYSSSTEPRLAFFEPVNFSQEFLGKQIQDIALGKDFSLFVCKNKTNNYTEVYGMGHNSEGQLASGFPRHIQKLTKVEPLSDFDYKDENGERIPLDLEISCGNSHCIAKGSNGAILTWGANKRGQLGNKKRSFTGSPLLMKKFSKKDVEHFKAFQDQSFISLLKQEISN